MSREKVILDRAPTSRVVGVVVALAGFSVAMIAGIAVDNPADVILARALVSLGCCFVIGVAMGSVCERVIADHVASRQQRLDAPAPEEEIVV